MHELFEKRVYRKSRSENSVNTYLRSLERFLGYVGLSAEALAEKVKNGTFNVVDSLNRWLDDLNTRDTAPRTQKVYFHAVKKFVEVTVPESQVNWKMVELPKTWSVEEDRPPTKQELKDILNHGNLKDRAIVLLAVSSGMREGTLAELQVGDVDFDAFEDIAVIKVRPEAAKQRIAYVTFATPEAKNALRQYLDLRKRRKGERETSLLNCKTDAIRARWNRLLRKADKAQKKRKFHQLHFHTLRKYFRTNLELAGVSTSFRERLLGHKGEYLDESYFKPQMQELLNEYRKAIPNLTILEPMADYEEIRKKQLLDTARLMGFGEEKLKRLEEVLARAKTTDEAIEEFKKLSENQAQNNNNVKIVRGEKELLKHLENGWTLAKELNHDKYLLKS
jgi:integrase